MGGALANDCSQWLGEERDGIWREAGVRKDLPEEIFNILQQDARILLFYFQQIQIVN